MKKLLTLLTLLAMFLGVNAQQGKWAEVYSIDYSSYEVFPFYVMGYAPSCDGTAMVDVPTTKILWRGDDGDFPGVDACEGTVTVNGSDFYVQETGENQWRQYFAADGIPTKIDGKYKVVAKVRATAAASINVNMGWGWEDGQQLSATVEIPESAEFQEVEWEYSGIGGSFCNLVAQPGDCTETIEWQSITVYEWQKEKSRPEVWLEDIENGNAEKTWEELGLADVKYNDEENNFKVCAWAKEKGHNMDDNGEAWNPFPANIELEEGTDNHVFVCHGQPATTEGGASSWDNQFWIQSKHAWKAGTTLKIKFRYKCNSVNPVTTNTQIHKQTPSEYLIWHAIGDITFTDQWQIFEGDMTINDDMVDGWSIAFNLNSDVKDAVDFYFDDLSWQYKQLDEGYFVSGINTNTTDSYDDLDNAIQFEKVNGVFEAVVGEAGNSASYVDQIMISTTRGDDQAFKGATLKPAGKIHNDSNEWLEYHPLTNAKLDLPGLGVWKISIDPEYESMSFEMLEGTAVCRIPIDIVTNTTEFVVKAPERDWLSPDGDGNPREAEVGTGETWDNQFWIAANRDLKKGEETILKFKYKGSIYAKTTTQVHKMGDDGIPCTYLNWEGVGDVNFAPGDWTEFEAEFRIPAEDDGMRSIAFNMAEIKEACDYSIKDVQWYLKDDEFNPDGQTMENLIDATGTNNFWVKVAAGDPAVYDPSGNLPPATYTLTITASGSGFVSYNVTSIRSKTSTFTVDEGASATVTFSPDGGNRIASVKLNGTDITSSVVNNKYTISNIKANTTLAVTFEAIPVTTHTFSITASGSGTATYNSTAVRGKTQSFTVNDGASATVTFTPDTGYRIASVEVNGTDVTSKVSSNKYTISNITANTTLAVTFEAIPPTTYTLSITSSGNGYVAYDGNTVRGKTASFSIVEGTNAILKFSADEGNRLKSVKVNGQNVTSTIVNNQYTVSNVKANTTIEVVFEAIPNYSLNIVATGNGKATYNGTAIRNQSQSFTLREGSSAVISFTPDTGYRIKSVTVNSTDVTSQVANGQITVSNITKNTNVEVSFEEIPPTTYSLTIKATGNGAVTYDGQSIRGGSSTFTVVEGSYATVQIVADDGYRLKRVLLDSKNVTADVADGQYTTTKIMANTTLAVEFEAVPTYTLTIKSSAFGSVKYGDAVITDQTQTFTVSEGTSAVLTFMADGNGRLQSITLNGNDITGQLTNGQYTISNIKANQSVVAVYDEDITKVTNAGVAYTVTSYEEQTVVVAAGNYEQVLTVPATFEAKGKTWKVTGMAEDALSRATGLAAIIWDPEVAFTAEVSNPNLLLYVKNAAYAPATIQNVVVGNIAEEIVLTEAAEGNNFYCPRAFTAKYISYEHNYSMITGYKTCQGWETIVLPFDVSMMISSKGKELVPYVAWQDGSSQRPFWLYQLTSEGWLAANGIRANVPYIISMPNNEVYHSSYNIAGNVQFIGNNVEVKASDNVGANQYGNWRLMGNYQNKDANSSIYVLNVNNLWSQNTDTELEGSAFIRNLRAVHPFEAYMAWEGSGASQRVIPIFDDNLTTAIYNVSWMKADSRNDDNWYTLDGRKLQGEPRQNGIYIYKGKKVKK